MGKQSGSKGKKAILTVLAVLVLLAVIVFAGARIYFRFPVRDYYRASEKAFAIPGLSDGLVPQGLDYIESEGVYLIGGYQNKGGPSRIYRVSGSDGRSAGYVVLCDEKGEGMQAHSGGLAVNGKYVFVTGDDHDIYVYILQDVLNGESGTAVRMAGRISLAFGNDSIVPAWILFTGDCMVTGEFYRVPNYPTSDTHIFTGSTGETNHAIALCYRLTGDQETDFGIEKEPAEAYSLPGLVQGMAVHDGKVWLSTSWGTARSEISCYDVMKKNPAGKMKTGNGEIPVYSLDSSTRVSSFKAAPMAEEIVFVDGKMLIMCESASNKYFFGNLTGGRWCYKTDVGKLKSGS